MKSWRLGFLVSFLAGVFALGLIWQTSLLVDVHGRVVRIERHDSGCILHTADERVSLDYDVCDAIVPGVMIEKRRMSRHFLADARIVYSEPRWVSITVAFALSGMATALAVGLWFHRSPRTERRRDSRAR